MCMDAPRWRDLAEAGGELDALATPGPALGHIEGHDAGDVAVRDQVRARVRRMGGDAAGIGDRHSGVKDSRRRPSPCRVPGMPSSSLESRLAAFSGEKSGKPGPLATAIFWLPTMIQWPYSFVGAPAQPGADKHPADRIAAAVDLRRGSFPPGTSVVDIGPAPDAAFEVARLLHHPPGAGAIGVPIRDLPVAVAVAAGYRRWWRRRCWCIRRRRPRRHRRSSCPPAAPNICRGNSRRRRWKRVKSVATLRISALRIRVTPTMDAARDQPGDGEHDRQLESARSRRAKGRGRGGAF